MIKYLLPKSGKFYKANLHCHSNISDGKWTIEEIKENYKKHGYNIVAFTDHDIMLSHHNLDDDSFLALTGVEYEFNDNNKIYNLIKSTHICAIAKKYDNETQPLWCGETYLFGNAPKHINEAKVNKNEPYFYREKTPKCLNKAISICKKKGFFVTYNHPDWSLDDFSFYIKLKNLDAMEIFNTGCVVEGYNDYCPKIYDDMLRNNQRVFCLMTDDNHCWHDEQSPSFDCYGGFTMIKAKSLQYEEITTSLEKGYFYSSQKPLIKSLWIENDTVYIKTSPVRTISMQNASRHHGVVGSNSKNITFASFKLSPTDGYFRLTLTDKNGKHAHTNAYFLDELNIKFED